MHIITADLIFRVSDLRSYTSCKKYLKRLIVSRNGQMSE